MIILPANTLSTGGYEVANSCRFNDGDSAYMTKTPGSDGNRQTFTISVWLKRGTLGSVQNILGSSDSGFGNGLFLQFQADDTLRFGFQDPNQFKATNRVFRDCGAWYNIIIAVNVNESSNSDRVKIFVNGTQETSFGTDNTMTDADKGWNNQQAHSVGRSGAYDSQYFDGYLAEVVSIDGSQLNASSFGEFDEDSPKIWKPIDVSGLTFGTNGFYLDFEDSANLGNDKNGGTDLTENNLAATDQCSDSATNNFCVMNVLDNYIPASTFSEGNCVITTPSSNYQYNTGTFGLTAGLWYFEMKMTTNATGDFVGIAGRVCGGALHMAGYYNDTWAYSSYDGKYFNNNTGSSYGDSWATDNTIIGVYIDLNANKLYFAKNGVVQNSGTGISITDPASVTNSAYHPSVGDNWNGDSGAYHMNFGNPTYALSSAQSDKNGYGQFEYDPSSGTFDGSSKDFLAICTKNLGSDGG